MVKKRRRIWKPSVFTPKTPLSDTGSNRKGLTPITPVSNKRAISSSHHKIISLHDWWLMKDQGKEGLAVGGVASMERLGERVICSTPIAKRHETNVLETQDGITIIVSGFINMSRTHENGFSLEICRHFLFGFPRNWEEYIPDGFGVEYNNGNTGFGDSNTCSLKSADSFVIDDNIRVTEIQDLLFSNNGELDYCWLPKKFFNYALQKSPENVSKQSDLAENMECNTTTKNKECEGKEDKSLKLSPLQVDQMDNIVNAVSDAIVETQDENPIFGFQSVTNMNSPKPCRGLSGKSTDKSPFSREREKIDPLSRVRKVKRIRQKKISVDAGNSCRRVTRSVSKMSHTTMILRKDEKITTCVSSPVRRSARLCNLKSPVSRKKWDKGRLMK